MTSLSTTLLNNFIQLTVDRPIGMAFVLRIFVPEEPLAEPMVQGKGDIAMTDQSYRIIFLVGALWNLLGSGLFFLLWRPAFAFFQLAPPHYLAFFQAWLALAFVFGIGYYYVYRDLYGNLNLVKLGIYGKTLFAVIFIYHVILSGFHPIFLSGAIIDLMFVTLFLRFLADARSRRL